MAIKSFEIGTSYGGLANVETLTTTPSMPPYPTYQPYSETVRTIDGGAATRGSPVIVWDYPGFMKLDMFNALRVICPGGSASVYIRSLAADYTTYKYYTATMIWPPPDSYTWDGQNYRGVKLLFTNLVEYTPPS